MQFLPSTEIIIKDCHTKRGIKGKEKSKASSKIIIWRRVLIVPWRSAYWKKVKARSRTISWEDRTSKIIIDGLDYPKYLKVVERNSYKIG